MALKQRKSQNGMYKISTTGDGQLTGFQDNHDYFIGNNRHRSIFVN